jgi:hypothetical protein
MGNLSPWPPETHYRCVEAEGCNYDMTNPPTSAEGAWSTNVKFGVDPVPVISKEPCGESASADTLAKEEL